MTGGASVARFNVYFASLLADACTDAPAPLS